MEPETIKRLVEKYRLEDRSEFVLDSIAWQLSQQRGLPYLRYALETICKIASRYKDSFGALKLIDESISSSKDLIRDDFEELNHQEEKVSKETKLALSGLETRIEKYLKKIKSGGNVGVGKCPLPGYSDRQYHGSFVP